MEIQTRQVNDITILSLTGSIDASTAPQVTGPMLGLLARGRLKLVADLGGVDYISSAGLRVFLGVIKEARLKGGDLRLAAVQPDVQHVLDISGFTSFIQFFGDVDSALAGF